MSSQRSKSHLLTGLGTTAEAGHRVRYVTAAALVNELIEAADDETLSRTIARYGLVRATQNQHNSGLRERSTRE